MTAAPAAEARPRRWIQSPLWDAFWVLSPLWLAPLVLVLDRGHEAPGFDAVDQTYLVLSALFWIGHRFSSTYLAYCTTAYRPLLTSQRTRFVWVPLGITALVFALVLPPDDALPFTRTQRVLGLVFLDYLLVTYHFAAQHFGFLSLYRMRAGRPGDRLSRLADRLFALGVGGALIFVAEAALHEVKVEPLVAPGWLLDAREVVRWLGVALVGAGTLGMVVLEFASKKPSGPRLLYVGGLALMVGVAFFVDPFLFLVLWTAQHWMAATGLASRAARTDPDPGPTLWYRFWHVFSVRPWLVVLLLMFVSFVLMPVMEVEATTVPEEGYGFRLFPFLLGPLTTAWLVPGLVALGLTTGFVHYALDRAVWRFSHPDVRKAARGALA